MSSGNEPAAPTVDANYEREYSGSGLTKREHMVVEMAKAIIGTSAAPALTGFQGAEEAIAKSAARMADALLAELAKEAP